MGKILSSFLLLFICLSCIKNNNKIIESSESKNYVIPFYDFEFSFKIYDEELGLLEELNYCGFSESEDNFRIIFIKYYEGRNKETLPLKKNIYISKTKMDIIYNILVNKITPNFVINRDSLEIPQFPKQDSEWNYGIIELNMNYRGDLYLVKTSNYEKEYQLIWEQLK